MSMKLRSLHSVAAIAGVQFFYTCKFHSNDLTRKSPGRTLWQTMSVNEALELWQKTTGEPHDQGTFYFCLEASIAQAGAIARPYRPSDNLDLFEPNGGVPAGLPATPDGGPQDPAAGDDEAPDGRGGEDVARNGAGLAS